MQTTLCQVDKPRTIETEQIGKIKRWVLIEDLSHLRISKAVRKLNKIEKSSSKKLNFFLAKHKITNENESCY